MNMKGIPLQFFNTLKRKEESITYAIEQEIARGMTTDTPSKVFLNERLYNQFSKHSALIKNEAISYSLDNSGLFYALLKFRKENNIKDADNLEYIRILMRNQANPNNSAIYIYKDYYENETLYKFDDDFCFDSFEPYLCAITYTDSCRNSLAKISKMVVHDYAVNVIKHINEAVICHDLTFLLYEIYNLNIHYGPDEFDSHLTYDIPEIPYSRYRNDLKGAYICLPENSREEETIEYLFITEDRYHHVKLTNYYESQYEDLNGIIKHIRYPVTSLKTKSYKYGKTIRLFGSETLLTPDGLTVLEMEHFGSTNLKFISDFSVDEDKLKQQITNQHIGYADNNRLAKMLIDYYTVHRGAWITSLHEVRTTYKASLIDLDYKVDFKSKESSASLVTRYWLWKNGAQQFGDIEDSFNKIICRKAIADFETVENNKNFEKNAAFFFRSLIGLIGISLLYIFW